jgi:hypothetical protein
MIYKIIILDLYNIKSNYKIIILIYIILNQIIILDIILIYIILNQIIIWIYKMKLWYEYIESNYNINL